MVRIIPGGKLAQKSSETEISLKVHQRQPSINTPYTPHTLSSYIVVRNNNVRDQPCPSTRSLEPRLLEQEWRLPTSLDLPCYPGSWHIFISTSWPHVWGEPICHVGPTAPLESSQASMVSPLPHCFDEGGGAAPSVVQGSSAVRHERGSGLVGLLDTGNRHPRLGWGGRGAGSRCIGLLLSELWRRLNFREYRDGLGATSITYDGGHLPPCPDSQWEKCCNHLRRLNVVVGGLGWQGSLPEAEHIVYNIESVFFPSSRAHEILILSSLS